MAWKLAPTWKFEIVEAALRYFQCEGKTATVDEIAGRFAACHRRGDACHPQHRNG
jgi:hypothetical protein